MSLDSSLFFLLTNALSWISLLIVVGGLIVCVSNQRGLPKLWLMSLGFAGLALGGLWNRVVIPLLSWGWGDRNLLGPFLVLSGLVHLVSMSLLVFGLAAVLSEVRQRKPGKDESLEDII